MTGAATGIHLRLSCSDRAHALVRRAQGKGPAKVGPMPMRAPFLFAALLMLGALAGPAAAAPAGAVRPVIVELFTAQGCEACAKANDLPAKLAARRGVLPLTFPVDYWDYLGWTDTFARPEFTARQKAYMRPLGQRDVFTPQVVVDGRSQAAGTRLDRIVGLVTEAAKVRRRTPAIRFHGGGFVRIESGAVPKGGAEAWLIRYEVRPDPVEIKDGENRGETIAYTNVVRELTRLGSWTGRRRTYALPKADNANWKTVIVLQGAKGGRVIGVLQR